MSNYEEYVPFNKESENRVIFTLHSYYFGGKYKDTASVDEFTDITFVREFKDITSVDEFKYITFVKGQRNLKRQHRQQGKRLSLANLNPTSITLTYIPYSGKTKKTCPVYMSVGKIKSANCNCKV